MSIFFDMSLFPQRAPVQSIDRGAGDARAVESTFVFAAEGDFGVDFAR